MDKVKLTLNGYSRAAFRTGFYIKELDLMLDAGPQNYNNPSYIFITHCHGDHIGELPFTLIEENNTTDNIVQIYGPPDTRKFVSNYIRSFFCLNSLVKVHNIDSRYKYTELDSNMELSLVIKNSKVKIKILECDHSVPTISFMFSMIKNKIKDEYRGLTGKEIVDLKETGLKITEEVVLPIFAYVCDCSILTIERYHEELGKHSYVIVECTFLYEEHKESAYETKHINWFDLKPYISMYPETTFILIHFSLRYRDEDIVEFFKKEKLPNVVYWVDDPADN